MNFGLFLGILCMVFFHRAASYERMSPWVWTLASLGLTVLASQRSSGLGLVLLTQLMLFVGMWWYNIERHKRKQP